jgi:glycerophosphoryl diester phosphodiesterase
MSNILNIAHRGARSLAPENTLAAARKAFEIGADMWELDVSVTADGELVLMHDDTLLRTTNAAALFPERAPWDVSTFTLAEIKSLDAGSFYLEADPFGQIAAGEISAKAQVVMTGEPVPTLYEALCFTHDHNWRVNVEIKTLPPSLAGFPVVEKTLALIRQLEMQNQVLLSSFAHTYLRQAKQLDPTLAIAVLVEFPPADPIKLLTKLGSQTYHPFNQMIEESQIHLLRQAGFEINVWTVNTEAEMRKLIQAGVTGLITDFPHILKHLTENSDNP